LQEATPLSSPPSKTSTQAQEQAPDGAALYAFLIGEGGEIDDLIADLIIASSQNSISFNTTMSVCLRMISGPACGF
jgi:hypothetical protein